LDNLCQTDFYWQLYQYHVRHWVSATPSTTNLVLNPLCTKLVNTMLNLFQPAIKLLGKRRAYLGILGSTSLIVGLLLAPQPGKAVSLFELIIRGAQIIQVSNISDAQELAIGAETNRKIMSQVRLHPSGELNAYVNNIGQNLARTSDRPNIKYTFQVVQDDAINAFATMGGFVYINSGLIKASDNEAQLASVVGHEIGHITGKHSIEQMKQAMIAQGITSAAGLSQSQAAQIGVELALSRPHSREMEYDADRRGLANIMKVGYAPSAMPEFMKKLASANSPPTFLSTHPSAPDRVARLNSMIPSQYRSNTTGTNAPLYRQRVNYLMNNGNGVSPVNNSIQPIR
jgi:beta-barrel assembly-enhancing protease